MGKLNDSREDGAISIGPFESTVELFTRLFSSPLM